MKIDQIVRDLIGSLQEPQKKGTSPYDSKGVVTRVEDGIAWVKLAGSSIETPVQLTISAEQGDNVQVRIGNGTAWLTGNGTEPPTGDKLARRSYTTAKDADKKALAAQNVAAEAHEQAEEANKAAEIAQESAKTANKAARSALVGLSTVEAVVETLDWLTEHSKATTDSAPVADKNYYIKNPDGSFVLVEDTAGKDPAQEGWYEMDEAIANYVASHLALTNYGLNLVLDSTNYIIHIGTWTDGGAEGVYVIDGEGNTVAFFGEEVLLGKDGGGRLELDSASVQVYDANNVSVAEFGSAARIGEDGKYKNNVLIDSNGMSVRKGTNVFTQISDQLIELGKSSYASVITMCKGLFNLTARAMSSTATRPSHVQGIIEVKQKESTATQPSYGQSLKLVTNYDGVSETGCINKASTLFDQYAGRDEAQIKMEETSYRTYTDGSSATGTVYLGGTARAGGDWAIYARTNKSDGSSSNSGVYINSEPSLGVHLHGDTVSSLVAITITSDKRLKEHINYIGEEANEFIRELRPAHYQKNGKSHVGFYAQDVQKSDRWDCMIGERDGYLTLGYTEIIAPLVAYCQHLEERIEKLEKGE